jgi:glycosyltransferase involved in cell wall biosynthesis
MGQMFCSVVIPTIGRESLSRAVTSVIAQTLAEDDFEIIVVNDSGQPLPPAEWQRSERVRVMTTNRRERSVARNAGASIARGKYLWFLDDDDWLLPAGLQHFWALARQSEGSAWLTGKLRVVDEAGKRLIDLDPGLKGNALAQIMGGVYVPIQASLIQSQTFFRVGGYDPLICGTEDLDLCRRIALYGGFAGMPTPVACLLRGQNWKTSTNYARAPDDNRRSRDAVLGQTGAFARMAASANCDYWYGRVFRIYLSTIPFNLQRGMLFTATSRGLYGLAWCIMAGWHTMSLNFWRGLRAHHTPDMLDFMRVIERQA